LFILNIEQLVISESQQNLILQQIQGCFKLKAGWDKHEDISFLHI
jgi:hypothetical protein